MYKQEDEPDESVLNAIIIASIIGIAIVAGLILFYPRSSENFTALYFGNYTKTPVNGSVWFNFTIETHENAGTGYRISYSINNQTISEEDVFVPNNSNLTLGKSLQTGNASNAKIQVSLNNSEEIHFWTSV